MALIKCPECGKEISDKAKACPNCGFCTEYEKESKVIQENTNKEVLNEEKNSSNGSVVLIAIMVILLFIVGFIIYWNATAFDRAVDKAHKSQQEYQKTVDELKELQDQLE